jgi:DNA-directed RNA polymerase subunit RPC12/RpoP
MNIIYCDYCGWKKLTKDFSDLSLVEVKSEDEKIKKFKCPSCGRLIRSRKSEFDPQKDIDLRLKKQRQKEELKNWVEDAMKYREEFEKNE